MHSPQSTKSLGNGALAGLPAFHAADVQNKSANHAAEGAATQHSEGFHFHASTCHFTTEEEASKQSSIEAVNITAGWERSCFGNSERSLDENAYVEAQEAYEIPFSFCALQCNMFSKCIAKRSYFSNFKNYC